MPHDNAGQGSAAAECKPDLGVRADEAHLLAHAVAH